MPKPRKDTSPEVSAEAALSTDARTSASRWLTYLGPHPLIARFDHVFARGQPREVRREVADALMASGDFNETTPETGEQ